MSALLSRINAVNDVKKLTADELPLLAEEIRRLILDVIPKTGGHLGSNLGVVELTLALHHVFDLNHDLLVWDGSSQTYTHKILTGRRDRFPTIRRSGGLSGFGWKAESATDPFNFGHVGTGLAAAFGCVIADEKLGHTRKVVAVVGDGALTSGVAFEALNNIGASRRGLLVILNDNGFSIARTVGAISTYFSELRTAPLYEEFKKEIHAILGKIPLGQPVEHVLDGVRRGLKQALFPNIFTALGFQYYGPIDGHDLKALLHILHNVRHQPQPVLLHVITKKGRGHPDADRDPFGLHKPVTFVRSEIREGLVEPAGAAEYPRSYTHAFANALGDLAAKDPRIVAITAAMPDSTGLLEFGDRFPGRCFDVGISEQCAVAFAAGLAQAGLRPVCAIYSSFLQRAFDIVFQEMCLNNLPVVLLLDRAGVAGEDGPTHHGNFDIAFLRMLPNIVLMAPKDEPEFREMLTLAFRLGKPAALRIPRETVPDFSRLGLPSNPVEPGKGEVLAAGRHGAILAYGVMTAKALAAREILLREGVEVTVANARFAKPLDADLAERLVREHPWVLTLEDHGRPGGFGSAVLEAVSLRRADASRVRVHAIPDRFLLHAGRDEILRALHLDAAGVAGACRATAAGLPLPEPTGPLLIGP